MSEPIDRRTLLKRGAVVLAGLAAGATVFADRRGQQTTLVPESKVEYALNNVGDEWLEMFREKNINVEPRDVRLFEIAGRVEGQSEKAVFLTIPEKDERRKTHFERRIFLGNTKNRGGLRELLPAYQQGRFWARFSGDTIPEIKATDGKAYPDFSGAETVLTIDGNETNPFSLTYRSRIVNGAKITTPWADVPEDIRKVLVSKIH